MRARLTDIGRLTGVQQLLDGRQVAGPRRGFRLGGWPAGERGLAYLVAAAFYDSAVSVAPAFWVVFGLSMAMNEMLARKNAH